MNREKIKILQHVDEEEIVGDPRITRLIDIGREKSYLTIDDILKVFPKAEKDVEILGETIAALVNAGIPYIEDDDQSPEPTEIVLKNEREEERQDESFESIQSDD